MKVITIGRDIDNDVVIDDGYASRHHLQIVQCDDGTYKLADFGSSNGTYVNGQKVEGEIVLEPNDIVRVGNTTIPWRLYFEQGQQEVSPSVEPSSEVETPAGNETATKVKSPTNIPPSATTSGKSTKQQQPKSSSGKSTLIIILTILWAIFFGYRIISRLSRSNSYSSHNNSAVMDVINAKRSLQSFIDTINTRTPYGDCFGQIDSFQYEDGNVLVHISIDRENANFIYAIKSNEEKVGDAYITIYSYPYGFQRSLLELMSDAKVGMTLDFKVINTNDSCQVYVNSSKVRGAVYGNTVGAMDFIRAENELINTRPEGSGDSYFKEVTIEGGYRVFYYQSEDYVVSYINSIRNQRKQEILNSYKAQEGEDLLKKSGLGMKYVFRNMRSGKECVITIENEEL